MDLLNKLNDFAKNITDKTADAIEIGKLNTKINSETAAISELMKQIGAVYYDKYTAGLVPDPDAAEFFASIDEHKACISEARSEIERIKAENEAAKAAAGAVICPSCGFANSHGTKFCQECGTKIESYTAVKVCPSCGAELSDNVKFCSNCGTKIE